MTPRKPPTTTKGGYGSFLWWRRGFYKRLNASGAPTGARMPFDSSGRIERELIAALEEFSRHRRKGGPK